MRFWVVMLLLSVNFVYAQSIIEKGAKYISLEADQTPLLTGAYFLQQNVALEAAAGFAVNGEADVDGFVLRLELDKYIGTKPLQPFYGGFARFDINPNALGETNWKGSRLNLGGQWGVNYFITRQLSVAGAMGVEIQMNSPQSGDNTTNIVTFTSGLKIRIFF